MDWRNEDLLTINEEKATKRYIKGELMNYYLYLTKYYELMDKKNSLYSKSIGGSIIAMPDGTSPNDSVQHRATMREGEIDTLQQPFRDKLSAIDCWMSILTKSQHDVIKTYVMKYQCEDVHGASLETKFSEDTIKQYTKRAIDRIYSRINKIL